MKFGQVFIGINLLIYHQVSAGLINQHNVASHAIPNGIASQTASESSGAIFPMAHEQLKEKLEFVPKPLRVQALKDYGMDSNTKELSPYHYRRLGQDAEQHFDSLPSYEAVGTNPKNTEKKKSNSSALGHSMIFALSGVLGMGLYAAVRIAWDLVESARSWYQNILDQLDIRYQRFWQYPIVGPRITGP